MAIKLSMFWRGRSGRLILLLFASMILLHLIVLGVFTFSQNTTDSDLNYNVMARQVTELIYSIQQTLPKDRNSTIQAIAIPNIQMSVDSEPSSQLMVNLNSPAWLMLDDILKQKPGPTMNVSVLLPTGNWLNVTAVIEHSAWGAEVGLFVLELIVVGAILITLFSINRFTGPLRRFRTAAEKLGVDVNPTPVAEYGPAIVRDTAHAINKMQERIQDLLRHRIQMLGALSHDLRTPITRLKLRAQFIDDKDLQEKVNKDLDQIEEMIHETLLYVRQEMRLDEKNNLDLNALLASICADYVDLGKPVKFSGLNDALLLKANVISLKRAMTNLIDNALKYAGSATVKLSIHKKRITIEVEDQGRGISDAEKDKVFDPFYRTEKSRSRETGGTGLGMAIVREVVQAHGGKISLHDAQPHGLIVKIVF